MSQEAEPARRLEELDEDTRRLLNDPEKMAVLKLILRYAQFFIMLGGFGKYLLWGAIGLAVGIVALGESVQRILSWLKG